MSLRNISLRQLRYFVAVAECGKIADAARRVAISQSVITTAMQELEDEVGVPLLERGPRGATLTFKGHQFLQRAYHILSDLENAVQAVRSDQGDIKGAIRLAVTEFITAYYLPAILTTFPRAWPHITIELVEQDRTSLEQGLLSGRFDLGIAITTNSQTGAGLSSEVLTRAKRHLWVSRGHELAAQGSVAAADVARHPYVLLDHDQVEAVTVNAFAAAGLMPKIAFRVSSVEAVRSLVANGAGVTMLADLLYRPWSLEGRAVERIDVPDLLPGTMDIGLIYPEQKSLAGPALALREFVRGAFSPWHDAPLQA